MKKAVVLLSGGLDSATVLAMATAQGYQCYSLSFAYGQRSVAEVRASEKLAAHYQVCEHKLIQLDLGAIGGSALTDHSIAVPKANSGDAIPVTYVPARNTVFLSIALGLAEVVHADAIFIGVNAVDYSGYPDCRPEFIQAFQQLANVATKAGVEGQRLEICTPLIEMSKAEIIQTGIALGVDYRQTVSCYNADSEGRACYECDACQLRRQGFLQAGVEDMTRYQPRA